MTRCPGVNPRALRPQMVVRHRGIARGKASVPHEIRSGPNRRHGVRREPEGVKIPLEIRPVQLLGLEVVNRAFPHEDLPILVNPDMTPHEDLVRIRMVFPVVRVDRRRSVLDDHVAVRDCHAVLEVGLVRVDDVHGYVPKLGSCAWRTAPESSSTSKRANNRRFISGGERM